MLSNYLASALQDHAHNKQAFSAPATVYVALLTSAPGAADTGTTLAAKEAGYTGYARKSVTAATGFGSASNGLTKNSGSISFAPCTAGSATVTHFAICDAASGGNVLWSGALSSSLAISNGITPEFSDQALTSQLS